MAHILIIIGGATLVIGMLIAIRTMKPMYFNVISGLIILVGTLFGLFGKQLQDKNSSEKSDKIIGLQNDLIKSGQEVKNLYKELSIAQQEVINYQKGGDSFCYVIIYPITNDGYPTPNSTIANVMLVTQGKFPLYNLQVTIHWQPFMELSEFLAESNMHKGFRDLNNNTWEVPVISEASESMTRYIARVPWKENGAYTIHFNARNGRWRQTFKVKRQPEGSCKTYYKVTDGIGYDGKILIEKPYDPIQ